MIWFYFFLRYRKLDATRVSRILSNSLYNKQDGIKLHRLEWLQFSIREATTWYTRWWKKSLSRIIIWLYNADILVIIDWRHLLEAYRRIWKTIPISVMHFTTNDAKKLFTKHYKSIHL